MNVVVIVHDPFGQIASAVPEKAPFVPMAAHAIDTEIADHATPGVCDSIPLLGVARARQLGSTRTASGFDPVRQSKFQHSNGNRR